MALSSSWLQLHDTKSSPTIEAWYRPTELQSVSVTATAIAVLLLLLLFDSLHAEVVKPALGDTLRKQNAGTMEEHS